MSARSLALVAAGILFAACSGGLPATTAPIPQLNSVSPANTQTNTAQTVTPLQAAAPITSLDPVVGNAPAASDREPLAAQVSSLPLRNILVPPAGTMYLGARVHPLDGSSTAQFETRIGRKLALDNHYDGWTSTFPGAEETDDLANSRYPVIGWNCGFSDASVAAGIHDADIVATAKNIKAYGHPIFLRWFWEMNLSQTANGRTACYDPATDDANGYFSASKFIAAWRHIHDVFAAQNVTNVVWYWCPSSGGSGSPSTAYYPGDAYVDWIGFDTYALGATQSFSGTFASMYAKMQLVSRDKPILVGETGAIAVNQVAWLTGADVTLKNTFPRVKGWMYFDVYKPTDRADWSLTTAPPPGGLAQFKIFASSAYMSARATLR